VVAKRRLIHGTPAAVAAFSTRSLRFTLLAHRKPSSLHREPRTAPLPPYEERCEHLAGPSGPRIRPQEPDGRRADYSGDLPASNRREVSRDHLHFRTRLLARGLELAQSHSAARTGGT